MKTLMFPVTLAILCMAFYVRGSDIIFKATPPTIQPLMTKELTLRCSLHDGPTSGSGGLVGRRDAGAQDMAYAYSIAITRNGVDVAMISEHISATLLGNSTAAVSGQLPGGSGEKGYLQLTWSYPGAQQAGQFVCDISGIDSKGHGHMFTKNLDISENEIAYADLINYIHGMQAGIDQLSQNISDQQKTNSDQQKTITDQQKTITDQAASISTLQQEITDVKQKQDTTVLFTALVPSTVTVPSHQTVVFSKVVTSVGGGYNSTTGVFTAPVSGYYVAHMYVVGYTDEFAQFYLQHNNKNIVWAIADDNFDIQSGSNSATLLVNKGDTVKVVADGTAKLFSKLSCTFSVQLISLI